MRTPQGMERFVTPEAVPLVLDVAGIGSRTIATILDTLIQGLAFLGIVIAAGRIGVSDTFGELVVAASFFAVFWGYFILFEGLWHGRTPGKAVQRIRVVRADGQPVGWVQVTVRNLVRIVDVLPAYYAIGGLSVLLTKRSQRLGDLAAGTIVVRDRRTPTPSVADLPNDAIASAATLDASAVREREYGLIRSFLERRGTLSTPARADLAAQLAAMARTKVPGAAGLAGGDERVLEAVAAAYRARFATGPALPPPP